MEPTLTNYRVFMNQPQWGAQAVDGVSSYTVTHRDSGVSVEFFRDGKTIAQFFSVTGLKVVENDD